MRYNTFRYLFFFFLLVIAGCRKDDLMPPRETAPVRAMGDFIRNNYDLSLFAAAIQKAGLLDSLNQTGPFTCFAPDNKAFNDMGITRARDFDAMNPDSLRLLVSYHVFKDRKYISEFPLQMGNKYVTLAGAELYVSVANIANATHTPPENRNVFVNGAMVYDAPKRNVALSNGVVHVIRKPLGFKPVTIQDHLLADTSLSIFVTVMKRCKLWDGLKEKGPFTVFAPDNEAFRKYNISADSAARLDPEKYEAVAFNIYPLALKPKRIFSTDWTQIAGTYGPISSMINIGNFAIKPVYDYNSYNNTENVFIHMMDVVTGQPSTNGPSALGYRKGFVQGADHLMSNGLVHHIDDLLLDPATLRK
ncbi:Uncaracterized surface protein containing fasciclin (FAS1) repeats [Chitinophaga eiseniae]|uniref:Uncaracterized surface protein containing fasciclin (FAS1) repeats n=1 Tax=Chitinophaga eiseniae TaxID=634771 RepID=A0A1T4M6L1_9BACT|nr:fasciclin domain-containing protein [Chitinophaga eiseniae]SJZ62364.1 Uncaracterized surface protein containing fasciclin (FAS1) repeats [Chitinophaga eiseniae]